MTYITVREGESGWLRKVCGVNQATFRSQTLRNLPQDLYLPSVLRQTHYDGAVGYKNQPRRAWRRFSLPLCVRRAGVLLATSQDRYRSPTMNVGN